MESLRHIWKKLQEQADEYGWEESSLDEEKRAAAIKCIRGIEKDDFDYPRIRRMIARNASSMTESEKKEFINALFGEE